MQIVLWLSLRGNQSGDSSETLKILPPYDSAIPLVMLTWTHRGNKNQFIKGCNGKTKLKYRTKWKPLLTLPHISATWCPTKPSRNQSKGAWECSPSRFSVLRQHQAMPWGQYPKSIGEKHSHNTTLVINTQSIPYPRDNRSSRFVAALFTIVRKRKQPRYPLTDEWMLKICYSYTMECHPATREKMKL